MTIYGAGAQTLTTLTGNELVQLDNGGAVKVQATVDTILGNSGSSGVTVVAAAGATQGTATAIPSTAVLVSVTVTTSSEGVKLPTAATGREITILPPTTKGVQVYAAAAGQVINSNATATTAFALMSQQPLTFYAISKTVWRVKGPGSAVVYGLTVNGTYKEGQTTLAAAGATQGTATAIPATAVVVNVTVTASTEGVKLPTVATGRQITLLTPTTKGYKVYAAAAGQVINAASTATTAYAMTTNHVATFFGVDTAHWRVQRGN